MCGDLVYLDNNYMWTRFNEANDLTGIVFSHTVLSDLREKSINIAVC